MVKDQEYLRNKASYCLDLAKKLGATSVSVSVGHSISESVSFRNKVLDESNRSDNLGVSITTYIDKKKSSISSSNLLDENIKTLIEKCIETTKITPEDEFNGLPDKNLLANKIKDLDLYDESHIENDKKIEYLKELETATSDNDKIVNTESGFTEIKSNFVLASSDGFCEGYKTSSFTASCVAVAKDDKSMERDYDYTSKCFLSDIKSSSHLAKETREKINIIFDKRIASSLLSVFSGAISGSAIARGTSFLKDKLGEQVFSKNINIIDQPDILKGLGSRPFDSEGVKTETLKLVEKGQLKSYLVDTYNGKKLNLKSNGRCGGTSNLFFENGELSFDELLKSNSKMIYVTETIGHGTNLVTGDYSVGAAAFLIENGEFKYPINEFTIAGNFKEMFNNLTLANDLEFQFSTNSPTAMVEGMVVAGK